MVKEGAKEEEKEEKKEEVKEEQEQEPKEEKEQEKESTEKKAESERDWEKESPEPEIVDLDELSDKDIYKHPKPTEKPELSNSEKKSEGDHLNPNYENQLDFNLDKGLSGGSESQPILDLDRPMEQTDRDNSQLILGDDDMDDDPFGRYNNE